MPYPRKAVVRARLKSVFPRKWTETWYQKCHSGRELSTPRQMSQGRGISSHRPPASPHPHCSRDTGDISAASSLVELKGEWGEGCGAWGQRKSKWKEANKLSALPFRACPLRKHLRLPQRDGGKEMRKPRVRAWRHQQAGSNGGRQQDHLPKPR